MYTHLTMAQFEAFIGLLLFYSSIYMILPKNRKNRIKRLAKDLWNN